MKGMNMQRGSIILTVSLAACLAAAWGKTQSATPADSSPTDVKAIEVSTTTAQVTGSPYPLMPPELSRRRNPRPQRRCVITPDVQVAQPCGILLRNEANSRKCCHSERTETPQVG
jgi:hypothetical protein